MNNVIRHPAPAPITRKDAEALAHMLAHSQQQLATALHFICDRLDLADGDPDLEDDSEDCCEAGDDGTFPGEIREGSYARLGDCEDDEDDDPGGFNSEDDFLPAGVQAWPSGPGCIIGNPDFGADGS